MNALRYHVLACDYDGTLALHGAVDEPTLAALERYRASGRKLLMVTGRRLEELSTVFARLDLFEWIVAENGALLYHPATRNFKLLGERPSEAFVAALNDRHVAPMDVGHVIVATWEPHETTVLETIRDFGLELQVIFNKGAVMVLPAGVNKATGLAAALEELRLSRHNAVAIGDAENDHALLDAAEVGVAVANAVPMLKERADLVMTGDHGAGVVELIEQLIGNDLLDVTPKLARHAIHLGVNVQDEVDVLLPAQGANVLVAGPLHSGKTPIVGALIEHLAAVDYQFCWVDPEGGLDSAPGAVVVGSQAQPPDPDEVVKVLESPQQNAVVNLKGVPLPDRPAAFAALAERLGALRAQTGRPHWIVVYDAHLVLPANSKHASHLPALNGLLLVTDDPKLIAPAALEAVDFAVIVGERPHTTLSAVAATNGAASAAADQRLAAGEALVWNRQAPQAPIVCRVARAKVERTRQRRGVAEGELSPERSFYFRGPQQKLNLRTPNLATFLQLAAGIDDETWRHHLDAGDYSAWFRQALQDETLADAVAAIEAQRELAPEESRRAIQATIEARYELPATKV